MGFPVALLRRFAARWDNVAGKLVLARFPGTIVMSGDNRINGDPIPNGLIQGLASAAVALLAVNFAFWPVYAPFGPDESPWELEYVWVIGPMATSIVLGSVSLFFALNPDNRKASDYRVSRLLLSLSFAFFVFAVIASAVKATLTWHLYIYTNHEGQTYVSTKAPPECVGAVDIRHFEVSGRERPRTLLGPVRVEDAETWLNEYRAKGFSFE